jgi:hypothetical protein
MRCNESYGSYQDVLSGVWLLQPRNAAAAPLTVLQTWSIKHPNTPAPSIVDAVKNHLGGSAGLYRGVCSTLLRDIPFSMLFFSMHGVIQVCQQPLLREYGLIILFRC